jgi:hypothetical protein
MSDNLNLYQKMFLVMNESEAIEKNMVVGSGKNAYKAVSEAAMLNLVKPLFKKYKLIIFPIDGNIQDNAMVWEKTNYEGKVENNLRAITELKVFYKIVDIESGESEILVGFGNGADPQDKGAGKSFTYSYKNVLSKTFMLFSGEDTDNTHSDDIGKQQPAGQESFETKKISTVKAATITSMLEKSKSNVPVFLEYYKIKSVADITNSQFNEVMSKLETKLKGDK